MRTICRSPRWDDDLKNQAPSDGGIPASAYVVAFVLYIAAGYALKTPVLNYVVGPLVPTLAPVGA